MLCNLRNRLHCFKAEVGSENKHELLVLHTIQRGVRVLPFDPNSLAISAFMLWAIAMLT